MFSAEDRQKRARHIPFQPYRILTSTGKTYDVMHPDWAFITTRAVMLPSRIKNDTPDQYTDVALIHIVELQELPAPSSASSNGSGST